MTTRTLPRAAFPPAPPARLIFPPVGWEPMSREEWTAFYRAHGIEPRKVKSAKTRGELTVYEVED